MKRFSTLTFVVAVWVVGCSSSGSSGGCTALGPIPGTAGYTGTKTDNAVNLQLSPEGINYINANWQQLIGVFAPGGVIHIPVACTLYPNAPGVGDIFVSDQGGPSGGRMDQRCDAKDVPADVVATITNFRLVARQPDLIDGEVSLRIMTGNIYLDSRDRSLGACLYLSGINASVNFDNTRGSSNFNRIDATLKFSIDQKFDKRLAFTATQIDGVAVCGASGASPQPACLDPGDLQLNGENNCGDAYLTILDWDPIKAFILRLLSPTLTSTVTDTINKQTCQACGTGLPACPSMAGAMSTCQSGVCTDTATSKCVPRFLGVEGRVNLGASMGNFGVPANAALDLSIHAGSSFSIDTVNAINIGTRGGMAAVAVAPCVPPSAAPPLAMLPAPDFRAEAPPISMTNPAYHLALGVSSPFLNLAFHQAHQGGVLCLQLSSATVGLINTGLFKTFLPSLGKLATRDGKDAPMMVVLRPAKPPEVKIGAGGMKPLITVTLVDLTIDFYASIDDRFARLFSITADITLPLSLTFSGCTSVTPAIGDIKQLVTNIRTSNAEMLAEDPKVLADLIPAVVGLAEPALAGALKPIDLPDLGPFKLKVNAGKGVGNVAGTENYNHLGLYATMLPTGAACATLAPRVSASLVRSLIPRADQMRLKGEKLEWPTAVLSVSAQGVEGSPEFATRIDDGLWTEFRAPEANGELFVTHPIFLLQGLHKIEVRGRVAEDPHGIGEPLTVPFMVDWDPPEVSFAVDRAHDRLVLKARDVISAAERLGYSYRVGDGAWSDYGPARDIIFSAIEVQGGVTARVRDEMGNVGEVAWRVPTLALRPDAPAEDVTVLEQESGCASVGVLPLLLAAGVLLRRRR